MLENVTLWAMAKRRMDWAANRQEVIAENIANANTPGYRSRDTRAFEFKEMVPTPPATPMLVTHPMHVSTQPLVDAGVSIIEDRRPFETKPDGNTVSLEEQSVKMSDTQGAYNESATLFQKYTKMYRTALGRGGS